jgi:hypothetical protein
MLVEAKRHYRLERIRINVRIVEMAIVLGFVALFAINQSEASAFLLGQAIGFALFLTAAIAWAEIVSIRTGLDETEAGFVDRGNFGSRRVAYEEIDRFEPHRIGRWHRVVLVRKDGRRTVLRGVFQSSPVVWEGGVTRDIVTLLNERLRRHLTQPRQEVERT